MSGNEKIEEKKTVEKVTLGEGINNFIQNNRKGILICLGVIVAALAGFIGGIAIKDAVQNKALSRVEDFNSRYEELRWDISGGAKAEEVSALLDDLTAFAKKTSGYAGGRAWAIIAGIRGDKKEWPEAEQAWSGAAKAASKTYLAPVALFNAAAAAEEQGNTEDAIRLYTECLAKADLFPAAARAQFSIGRLRESQNNRDAALDAYRTLISRWPGDPVWTNLAQNRIITLQLD
jgi:tetratricopeptide (TPR) repeat protein